MTAGRALRTAVAFAALSMTVAVTAPAPLTPEETARLAARPIPDRYHEDRYGCYVPDVPAPAASARPIPAPGPRAEPTTIITRGAKFNTAVSTGQDVLSYHLWRAEYALQEHAVAQAIAEYRIAAKQPSPPGVQPNWVDYVARLPLSTTLFRAGQIHAAREEWRTMLHDRDTLPEEQRWYVPSPSSIALLEGRRLNVLAERAVPNWSPSFFISGAGQHMVRGTEAAKKAAYATAAAEWRTSIRCDTRFEPPHLLLGYYDMLKADLASARREWIAALDGTDPGPGDMLGITSWQYDAMAALLRYTSG